MDFENARIHSSTEVPEHVTNLGFKRMEHPPYRRDLALSAFLLFGAMNENVSGHHYVDEFFPAVGAFVRGCFSDFLQTGFSGMGTTIRGML
jgi:hypothetical protein